MTTPERIVRVGDVEVDVKGDVSDREVEEWLQAVMEEAGEEDTDDEDEDEQ